MSDSRFYHVSPAGRLAPLATATDALAAARTGGYAWLDFFRPDRGELAALSEPLGLHPLAIEDCTDSNQVPKLEDFPGHTFLIFNAFSRAGGQLAIDEVDLFIGENFLITVSGVDSGERRPLDDIARLVEKDGGNIRQGPAFLMHIILDQVVDRKFLAIEALEEALDGAEEALLADVSRFDPAELLRLRRELLSLRKSLFHEREILVKLCRKDCPFIAGDAIFHYRDIYDHLAKFFELTETSRDIVTSLMEMYLSMVNNQMARVANATNLTVRRLTFITTIFMPLTLLAGIGGMSEWSMMTGPAHWRLAYPLFLLGMVLIGVASAYLLKWLEKRGRDREGL